MLTRRQLLRSSSLIALAPSIPNLVCESAYAAEVSSNGRVLVVIQLGGGNDGFNTVIPYDDEAYIEHRPGLRLPQDRILKIADGVGLHPSMREMAELFERQLVSIVQGVGYPNPSRSHDVSMANWQTARFDPEDHHGYGWLGRALDLSQTTGRPGSMLVGTETTPIALRGRRSESSTVSTIDEFHEVDLQALAGNVRGEATDLRSFVAMSIASAVETANLLKDLQSGHSASSVSWPSTELAARLKLTAQLIKADLGARVYYTIQPGYDTHAAQSGQHSRLLRTLSQALKAFFDDLAGAKLDDRVLVLCFSEFGRQLKENASGGTDHGTAGPVILAGSALTGGIHGAPPDLKKLTGNAPNFTTDFRRVYATVLQDWLDLPCKELLGGQFEPLKLLSV